MGKPVKLNSVTQRSHRKKASLDLAEPQERRRPPKRVNGRLARRAAGAGEDVQP